MSNSIRTTRVDPREEQLIEDVRNRRALFSSFSVLMSGGVVALTVLPSMAHARSALDDMPWAPSSITGAQAVRAPVNTALADATRLIQNDSAPAALARPSTGGAAPKSGHAVTAALADAVQTLSARPVAEPAATPRGTLPGRAARSFADMGLGESTEQRPDRLGDNPASPAPRAAFQTPVQPVVVQNTAPEPRAAMVARNVASAPIAIASSPMRPSLTIKPPRDMQADLIAVRRTVASEANVTADDTASRALPLAGAVKRPAPQAQDVNADVAMPRAAGARKSSRKSSDNDVGYADWLDDSTSAKALADSSVVPESVVRTALRNAADTAAERSAAIRQARNDWDAAKFDVDQVKGQRWPQIQVGGNSPALQGTRPSFSDSNQATANINVTTMVYDWGKTSKNIDSRTKTAEANEFYYKTVVQQNAYDVSSNLVELAKNRAVYAIGESYVKRMAALVDMLAEIVKVDPGRLSELSQAKSRLVQAQTSQETVASQLRSLELSVRKLIGDQPAAMPRGTRWQLQLDGLDDAVAAVAQNPAIEQAAAEAAAATANAKSVRAGSLPQLDWVISKTTAHDTFNQRQPWTTMLQLTWRPFQGGSQQAAERAALARAESSSDKREQLQLDSEFKVRDAHRDAIALATRAKLYAELSVETDVIRKQFFEQWYHLNRRTLVDVLSAESDFYNNQVSQMTTQFDAYQSILKIHFNNGTLNEWLQGA